jgi:N-acetyl-gamma-glutamyl-phosphate reductase
MKHINTAILGASGYTGAELLRLLNGHPLFKVAALTGDSQAGKAMVDVYPHLRTLNLPKLVKHQDVDFSDIDLVFCCLPHGTTQEIIAGLPKHVRIVDLSADFRLHDIEAYKEWYEHDHRAPHLQAEAVYGLTEYYRDEVKKARLVANPGCYPTCSLLPLLPLIEAKLIVPMSVGIDAMSGISGAGRSAKQEMLFTELDGGVSAYSVGRHRHMAEIDQEISRRAKTDITASFTPHLVPITRGMLATIHAALCEKATVEKVRDHLKKHYKNEPFVKVLDTGSPSTHQVRGTNFCFISVHQGRIPGELIIISVIDNLVKGASGQALQNANLMFGLPETTNLEQTAIFP